MQVTIDAQNKSVAIDGVGLLLGDKMPKLPDDRVMQMHWNGSHGEIHRRSVVPGRVDFEHFADQSILAPFVAAWQVAKGQRDEHVAALAAAEAKRLEDFKRQQDSVAVQVVAATPGQ